MVPGGKDLLLEHSPGDQMLGSPVDQILHGQRSIATRDLQMSNFFAHSLSGLGSPFRVAEEVVVFGRVLIQMMLDSGTTVKEIVRYQIHSMNKLMDMQ